MSSSRTAVYIEMRDFFCYNQGVEKKKVFDNHKPEIRVVEKSDDKLRESLARMTSRIAELERSETRLNEMVARLQELSDKHRQLVELIPDAVIIHLDGKMVFANKAAVKLVGAKDEEDLLGRDVLEFVCTEMVDLAKSRMRANLVEKKATPLIEEKLRRLDGSIFYAEVAAIPYNYEGKAAAQVVVRDITARKKMEKELEHRLGFQRLIFNLSTRFINMPMEDIEEGIEEALKEISEFIGVDRSYLFTLSEDRKKFLPASGWCAGNAEKMAGVSEVIELCRYRWMTDRLKRFENVHITSLEGLPPDASAEKELFTRRGVRSAILVPIVIAGTTAGFLGLDSVSKATSWADDTISLLRLVGEMIMNTLERKRATDELLKIQKLESIGTLAGGIAHNYNNILTGILGNISLAKLELNGNDKIYPLLEKAERAAIRAGELTQKLITFAGGGVPSKHKSRIGEIIKNAVKMELEGSKSKCIVDIPKEIREITCDPAQIEQVIRNLLKNADEAMPAGGAITVTAENITVDFKNGSPVAQGDYVKITVEDEGCGIAGEIQGKIFDPFFTTQVGRSGLGLAVAYSVVNAHDGNIFVESAPTRGAKFSVYLPVGE